MGVKLRSLARPTTFVTVPFAAVRSMGQIHCFIPSAVAKMCWSIPETSARILMSAIATTGELETEITSTSSRLRRSITTMSPESTPSNARSRPLLFHQMQQCTRPCRGRIVVTGTRFGEPCGLSRAETVKEASCGAAIGVSGGGRVRAPTRSSAGMR